MGEPTTKTALIKSAVKMFRLKGFQMTRVSDIVSDAGVAQGTFYNYFHSKEEVFREVCNDFINQVQVLFVKRAEHMFDGDTSDEVVKNVHHVVRDLFQIYYANLDVTELLFREGIGNGGIFKEIYKGMLSIFLELIEAQVEKAMNRGFIQVEDPEVASVFLFGLFERTLLYFMLTQKTTDLEKLERMLIDFMLKGLAFDYHKKLKTPG